VAVVLAGAVLAPPARGDICVVVDPVLSVGCASASPAPPRSATAAPAGGGARDDGVALSSTHLEHDPGRIAVTAARGATPREVAAAFAAAGVSVDESIPAIRAYLLRVAPERQADAVRRLAASAAVARAAPDVIAHALDTTPNDAQWPAQDGLRLIGLPRAWDTNRGSSQLIVAVVDTGVDANQPDLRGALVPGMNFVDGNAPPLDDHGHGTAVAGIVAARADNGQGIAGVCWFCLVMPVKVLDSKGNGDDTRIAAGIVWAAEHGARVINLSLGGPGTSPELAAAIAYATWKGAVVVAAAGNSGTSLPFYPAADVNALSVAATTSADRAYSWSNYGTWVAVAAPGCNVAPARGGGYGRFCGTSSAAPVVAGLAALALSAEPGAAPADVRSAIEHGATPLAGVVAFGRVTAPQTLAFVAKLGHRVRAVKSGVLTAARPVWTFVLPAAPALLAATLRFRPRAAASLRLDSLESGTLLDRVSGGNPLRLVEPVPGPVRVTVRARSGFPLRYRLVLSYAASES
jgi:subtilisin family serine protease